MDQKFKPNQEPPEASSPEHDRGTTPPSQNIAYPDPNRPYGNPSSNLPPIDTPSAPVPQPPNDKNVVGLIALITAGAGFLFACIPATVVLSWVLLPVGFILGIVGVCLSGKKKGAGITAIILAVVGTVIAIIVSIVAVGNAIDNAVGGSGTTVTRPQSPDSQTPDKKETDPTAPASEDGSDPASEKPTRENPAPIGSVIKDGDWSVVVNSVDLNANDVVADESKFNDPPAKGNVFILVNITATFNGDNPDGETAWVSVDFVTKDGNTVDSSYSSIPDRFDSLQTLYQGASTTGNILLEVPAKDVKEGVLKVTPTIFGDKVFVAVQ